MDNDKLNIPYIAYESAQARMERVNNRLLKALICLILALFLSNALWLWAWVQYDYTSDSTVTVDGKDGIANYIGDDGDITNGEDYSTKDENPDTKEQ